MSTGLSFEEILLMKLSRYQLTLLVLVVVGIANVVAAAFVAMVVVVAAISAVQVYTEVNTVAMAMLNVGVPAVMPVIMLLLLYIYRL